jgi:7-cyano-7-deazaguanine synthase
MCQKQVDTCQRKGLPVEDLRIVDTSFMYKLLKGSSALMGRDIDVPTMDEVGQEEQPITYVPFRNAFFLTLALSYAEAVGATTVYYGAQKQDYAGYWDTTVEFVDAMNAVAKLNRKHQIHISAPFVELRKSDEIIIGKSLGVNYADTWSSYEVVDEKLFVADSLNPTSTDRILAFAEAGIVDPQVYSPKVNWGELLATVARNEATYQELEEKIAGRL